VRSLTLLQIINHSQISIHPSQLARWLKFAVSNAEITVATQTICKGSVFTLKGSLISVSKTTLFLVSPF
jgi:acyl-CoA thioesterase